MKQTSKTSPSLLFETSWEVCNKVGGIYAVLSTKARTLQSLYKNKVIFVGPDVWTDATPSPYFTEVNSLLADWRKDAKLPKGVSVRVGRWNVPGRPITILVKFDAMYAANAELFKRMWELYKVDSLHAYGDYPEAAAFSHAAALVIESICRHMGYGEGEGVIAHFDEWTTGMGLLHVKAELPKAATVFTTHATSIGRSICGNGKQLYAYFSGYNGDQMADELNMQSKHSLEKAAAHQADCFTTVSDVTARECCQLLEAAPHVTPNGFEKDFVPATAKAFGEAREKGRKALLKMASALVGRKLPQDSFLIATSGRCEYRNKGIDVFLDAAATLRGKLTDSDRQTICFVMVPAWSREARPELVEAIKSRKQLPAIPDPVMTHGLNNYDSDPIIQNIHRLGFCNRVEDNLLMIYVPCYLDGSDGLFGGLTYYDLIPALDATVFPSYYEPWGYTPLESVAFGVPTITTTLAGFGQWVNVTFGENTFEVCGVHVNERNDGNYSELCEQIATQLLELQRADQATSSKLRKAASATADLASWKNFITYYQTAYNDALLHAEERNK
ncbi:MAG: glycogen/starch synthase [Bacteroides sp.]|nr:glycogen/starch synthase [Bacteroides sp.]MCM1379017.1 glycogen/starch synthase [Bacteroides sp.]MCM1445633.1 glycogen/starch synthase [Prevotella sp.]